MRRFLLPGLLTLMLTGCGAPVPAPTMTQLSTLDCDRDGKLNREEVQAFWINHTGRTPRVITDAEFAAADRDGDAMLNLVELSSLLTTAGDGWGYSGSCR